MLKYKAKTGYVKKEDGATGQMCIASDGRHLAFYTGNKLLSATGGGFGIMKFDRCDGTISDFKSKVMPQQTIGSGVAFSQDGRYLFVCNNEQIRQYDTEASDFFQSERLAAQDDDFFWTWPGIDPDSSKQYQTNFCSMQLGPDGKIYVFSTVATNHYLSVVEYPNEAWPDADVRQHSIKVPKIFTRTVPNVPNYRLGPLDGSTCDTLGLDNHPIAKYRYEPDTIDYKRIRFTDLSYFRPETWSWDFGDNSPKIQQRNPYHTYAQNGTYKVCLTVSNENSSNTSCRNITIGTSATDNDLSTIADVTFFPNPVQDNLLVTIGDYIPERGYIELYNLAGQQVHKQRAYYGHNNVDMTQMTAGTYILRIVDGGVLVREEKVVKI
jgi:hypothetical protein